MTLDPDVLKLLYVGLFFVGALGSWLKAREEKIIGSITLVLGLIPLTYWSLHIEEGMLLQRDLLAIATAALALMVFTMPAHQLGQKLIPSLLFAHAGVVLFFVESSPIGIIGGWLLSVLPLFLQSSDDMRIRMPKSFLMTQCLGCLALIAGLGGKQVQPLFTASLQPVVLFGAQLLLLLAVILRQGLFPAHALHVSWHERGYLPLGMPLASAPLGLFLVASHDSFHVTTAEEHAFYPLAWFFVLGLVVYGLLSLVQKSLRSWTALAQAFLLTLALLFALPEGSAGIVEMRTLLWTSSLLGAGMTYLAWRLELRLGPEGSYKEGGLARVMPHMAGLQLVFGLAFVGLPFTMGFVTEDVWLHLSHQFPWPAITAMVISYVILGIGFYQIYARGALGSTPLPVTQDLVLKEKLALILLLVPLILFGTVPNLLFGF